MATQGLREHPRSPAITHDRLTRSLLLLGILVGPLYAASGLALMTRVPGYPLAELGFGALMLTEVGIWQRIAVVICGLMQVGLSIGFLRAIRGPLGWIVALSVAISGGLLAMTSVFLPDPVGVVSPAGTANLLFAAASMALTTVSAAAHAAWAFGVGARAMSVAGFLLAGVIVAGSAAGLLAGPSPLTELSLWIAAIAAWAWTLVAAAYTRSWVRRSG